MCGHLLDALQHIQAAAAAVALHRIGGVGHQLQFPQHELRDHQNAVQKPGFRDVRDAAVDNNAGIEDLETLFGYFFPAEQSAQSGQIQHFALVCADHQADVRHNQQNQ